MSRSDITDRINRVFLPGSPIKDSRYLIGRKQEQSDLLNIVERPGLFGIVTGDRGVGKTSLVKQVVSSIDNDVIWITCAQDSNFQSVFIEVFENFGVFIGKTEEVNKAIKSSGIGGNLQVLKAEGAISREKITTKSTDEKPLTSSKVFQQLSKSKDTVIVLDEFDAINFENRPKFNTKLAPLMKQLADNNEVTSTKIIVIGVAKSAEELLGRHLSIQRSAREIYLRPLRGLDIREFLSTAEDDLGIHFDEAVKQDMVTRSMGYPYFVHLVGLESIDAMLRRSKSARVITAKDYEEGMNNAVDKSIRAELNRFSTETKWFNDNEEKVIKALALMQERHPSRVALKKYCSSFGLSENEVDSALLSLYQDKRFIYISNRSERVAFVDPLMKPFLRAKGERFGLLENSEIQDSAKQLKLFEPGLDD